MPTLVAKEIWPELKWCEPMNKRHEEAFLQATITANGQTGHIVEFWRKENMFHFEIGYRLGEKPPFEIECTVSGYAPTLANAIASAKSVTKRAIRTHGYLWWPSGNISSEEEGEFQFVTYLDGLGVVHAYQIHDEDIERWSWRLDYTDMHRILYETNDNQTELLQASLPQLSGEAASIKEVLDAALKTSGVIANKMVEFGRTSRIAHECAIDNIELSTRKSNFRNPPVCSEQAE